MHTVEQAALDIAKRIMTIPGWESAYPEMVEGCRASFIEFLSGQMSNQDAVTLGAEVLKRALEVLSQEKASREVLSASTPSSLLH